MQDSAFIGAFHNSADFLSIHLYTFVCVLACLFVRLLVCLSAFVGLKVHLLQSNDSAFCEHIWAVLRLFVNLTTKQSFGYWIS
jgi:hypothetical protein